MSCLIQARGGALVCSGSHESGQIQTFMPVLKAQVKPAKGLWFSGFAAVPVPPAETWQTVCSVPGHLGKPSPLQVASNPHGLQKSRTLQ